MDADGRRFLKFTERVEALPSLKKETYVVEVFQNQRREENKWHQKYLYDVPPFSCGDGGFSCLRFPKNLAAPKGFVWGNRWRPDVAQTPYLCDENGWTYGATFDQLFDGTNTSSVPRETDRVRRRRWVRSLDGAVVQYKWKDERLGMSLVEPPNLDFQKCIHVDTRAALPVQLLPVGATKAAVIKQVAKEDLHAQTLLGKGDILVRVNDVDVALRPFDEIMRCLEEAFAARPSCALQFAAASGRILIKSCTHAAAKGHLHPGFRLVGLNDRSVKHLRLMDVEAILRLAPRNSCVLTFHESSDVPPPFAPVGRALLCVKEPPPDSPQHCASGHDRATVAKGGGRKWSLGLGALFASTG
ncbi:Aste57867_21028 [Aphanomyces stellatus]|uniref:Aste57867_21028 protein n=1 Tax=Aphanomyces stellatus TaxID=120398 RepID=A0A485LIJ9_9STRA|nr:hypothetical protein As57867_020960 [Aphanomyces stellatus]VFT97703.1 Aste57867_21028 [Aphanomyces stellatus]